jgi:osmotically inducible protein OsmC
MNALYTAHARATGDGRNGHVTSSDGLIDTDVAVPAEMGGKGGATNPEQLFAAGYAVCFHNALRLVARRMQASVDGSEVSAAVGIGPIEGGRYGIQVALKISLPGVEAQRAKELVDAAHQVCPYSNATRGNIEVDLQIV